MFQSRLEESWSYQEIVQKGLDQGLEIGIKQGIEQGELKALRPVFVRIVERNFGELASLAQQQADQVTSPVLLSNLIDKLLAARTLEQARQILMGIEHVPDEGS